MTEPIAWIDGNRTAYMGKCPWCGEFDEKLQPTDRKGRHDEMVCRECKAKLDQERKVRFDDS